MIYLWVPSKLLEEGDDDPDVLLLHHVESLGAVVEDAVEHVHHARPLTAQLREQPVQALGLNVVVVKIVRFEFNARK